MMQFIKGFKNIQRTRTVAHTNKLHFLKYYHDHGTDKESDCAEQCLLECSQLNLCPDECQTVSDKCQIDPDKCQTVSDKCQIDPDECQTVSDKCQIEPDECQTVSDKCQTEISNEKCGRYNKYSFHDFLIQSVTYIETQPSNKEFFEPKGTLDKQIKMDNKTK
ncbi:uncharacterized protein LOC126551815 [Aphis gossypii]|uniref:Uncharacterized protein n=1 Tax=Aphis gossypii TaxID=80765 RepID=A0A9P0JBS7_APHGO|nr:uncharacterized protein LOC126551815 [Aphis gossypii]CAH1731109.1 unnamed protein product [Aphis gossypii]